MLAWRVRWFTHGGFLEVHYSGNSPQWPQHRCVEVIADGYQGPHQGFGGALGPRAGSWLPSCTAWILIFSALLACAAALAA